MFSSSPVIPVIFLIHERKFKHVHDNLMQQFALLVPNLSKTNEKIPMVTNDEAGIVQAITKYLPDILHRNCWNHMINAGLGSTKPLLEKYQLM